MLGAWFAGGFSFTFIGGRALDGERRHLTQHRLLLSSPWFSLPDTFVSGPSLLQRRQDNAPSTFASSHKRVSCSSVRGFRGVQAVTIPGPWKQECHRTRMGSGCVGYLPNTMNIEISPKRRCGTFFFFFIARGCIR